jgi:uncharacterized repeat protein (TIGR03803 family)
MGPAPPQSYTIGGTVQGLAAPGLVLANGSDTLEVPETATQFTMPTAVANGSAYDVMVQVNPTALNCTVISGAGAANGANVTSVTVSCMPGAESVLYSFTGGALDGEKPGGTLLQASDGNFYGTTPFGGANGAGIVFKITPTGSETVLYSFQGGANDGGNPAGELIQGSDGNFYGMTSNGGPGEYGTVYKITPSGVETVLHFFQDGSADGAYPSGGLVQGSDGNFYGMASQGGAHDTNGVHVDGVVFKITPSGTMTVLHSFQGGPTDGAYPLRNLILATDGNFYGVTPSGGAVNGGTVFKITPSGTETLLYSFESGLTDGISPSGSLIQASDGNFYGTTSQGGGGNEYGTVFKVTAGGTETVLYAFQGGPTDGTNPQGSLIQASDGNFYGMTEQDGRLGYGSIFKITPSGAETVLHFFQGGTTDGVNPFDSLIQAPDGNLYGMTNLGGANNLGTIFKFN